MGVFGQWFITFIVVKFGPLGITNIGWRFYLLFCVFNVVAAVFVFFFVKETKGLGLEQIDVLFARKDYKHVLEARLRGDGSEELKQNEDQVEVALKEA